MKQFLSLLFPVLFFLAITAENSLQPVYDWQSSSDTVVAAATFKESTPFTYHTDKRPVSIQNTTSSIDNAGEYYGISNQKNSQKSNQIVDANNPSYTLQNAATTSAGVYDGDVLIRTLWNNEKRSAGTYDLSTVWDGKDDDGKNVANKNYTIKVVSNNVTYEWLRPIGNTSENSNGPSVHHSMQLYTNMVQVGNDMYCANGYNEIGDSHMKFTIGRQNRLTTTLKGGTMVPRFLASDGIRVYYAGQARDKINFTTAITPNPTGTDALYSFSTGRQIRITGNNDYQYSGIDYDSLGNFPTGLAVQKTGDRLLISHAISNELRIFNKTTGALVRKNVLSGVRHLALQNDNAVWLSKYSSHTGTTTPGKLSGIQIGSEFIDNNFVSNAFDQISGTFFRTTGGAYNYVGLEFPTRRVITQVKIKSYTGTSLNAKILGCDGWESVELGSITSTNGAWSTVNITNSSPFQQIKIDNHDGPQMYIDEVEFYGYSYSGVPLVSRHTLNSDGTLGAATIILSGVTEPLAVAVSPDGTKVAVVDRGAYHQVKFFDTSSGSLLSTIGRAETYNNPNVYNDKFYFNNTRIFREDDYGASHAFIAFQTDGSFWVGDYGNMRCQHFSSSGTYLDNIQYLGYSYNSQVDINKPTRVFSDYLEFEVDYGNNSWRFVRNWTKTLTKPREFDEERFRSVVTLSNSRTYALFVKTNSGPREVVELITNTGVRHTGILLDNDLSSSDIDPDGSQWQRSSTATGQSVSYKRKPLTGFDNNNNPIWGSYTTVETTPAITVDNPLRDRLRSNSRSTSGLIATFNADNNKGATGSGYHLGGIKNGQWVFRTSHATRLDYSGDYPDDGAFDIGNGVNYAGTFMQVVDRNIFWGYKGEFWKAGQTNMHNHFLDNGLMVGQFGVPGDVASTYGEAAPMMAGNATTGTYVKIGNDIHFFHADESHHAAVHHWKISNLGSIQEMSIPVTKANVTNPPKLDYVNLMETVPTNTKLAGPVGRWSYSPAIDDTWKVQAGLSTYKQNDRSMRFTSYPVKNGLTREAYCDLSATRGNTNNYSGWQITGLLMYPEIGEPFDNFLDVVDNTGKVIVRISRPQSYPTVSVKANSTTIVSDSEGMTIRRLFQNSQKLSIRRTGNTILVGYAGYPEVSVSAFDPAANLNSPTTLRIHFYSADTRGHQIDLANLRFYSTPVVTTGTGLMGQYYNNKSLSEPLKATRIDSTINFYWGQGSPIPDQINVDQFSIRWSGQVEAPVSGTYVFSTTCDDGVRLWINGALVINNWNYHATIDNSAPILLTAGQKYDIVLEYNEGAGGAGVRLLWAYPGQAQQIIPKQRLYPAQIKSSSGRIGSVAEEALSESSDSDRSNFVKAYPVPAHDFLFIKYQAKETGEVSIKLTNVNAQSVLQSVHQVTQGENTLKIQVRGFPAGIYLLNLAQGYERSTKRVILSDQ